MSSSSSSSSSIESTSINKEQEKRPIITIFSITNCKYCTRAKTLLKQKALSYQEINIELYPNKRNDMYSYSNSFTVPQLFFGNVLIGGCDKLEEFLDDNENVSYDDLMKDYASTDADDDGTSFEFDERLSIPSYPPTVSNEEPLLRNEDNFHYLKLFLAKDSSYASSILECAQVADSLANDLAFVSENEKIHIL